MVYCINKSHGCTWSGEMKQLTVHLLSCESSLVPCPKDCGDKIERSNLEFHIQSQCSKLATKCDHCGRNIEGAKVTDHNTTCLKFPAQCPFLCSSKFFPRDTLDGHLKEECTLNTEKCVFSATGCHYNGPMFQHEEHVKNYAQEHLMLACGVIARMEQDMADLKIKNKELKDEMTRKFKVKLAEVNDLSAYFWNISNFSTKLSWVVNERTEYSSWVVVIPSKIHMRFYMSTADDPLSYGIYLNFNDTRSTGATFGSVVEDITKSLPLFRSITVTIVDQVSQTRDNSITFQYSFPKGSFQQQYANVSSNNAAMCLQKVQQEQIKPCLYNNSLLIKFNFNY